MPSQLAQAADRLEREAEELVDGTARRVLAGAQARTRDRTDMLDQSMRIETDGPFDKVVAVGFPRGRGFYAHMVENGTVHASPHPFLTPAAEEERVLFRRGIRDLFR